MEVRFPDGRHQALLLRLTSSNPHKKETRERKRRKGGERGREERKQSEWGHISGQQEKLGTFKQMNSQHRHVGSTQNLLRG